MAWEKFQYARTNTVLKSLIMITDEYAEFADLDSLPNSERQKVYDIQAAVQSIARLGRSAHIHIIIATQSSTGNLFPASLKNNVQFRNICGRVDGNVSRMAIDTEEGESIPTSPGAYLGWCKGDTLSYQGWFTKTKDVLALGTIRPGYDPKTGKELAAEGEMQDFSNLPTYQEPAPAAEESMSIGNDSSAIPDAQPTDQADQGAQQMTPTAPPNPGTAPAPIPVPADAQPAVPVEAQMAPAPQPAAPLETPAPQPLTDTPLDMGGLVEVDLNSAPAPMETPDLQTDPAPAAARVPQAAPAPMDAPAATPQQPAARPAFNVIGANNAAPAPQPGAPAAPLTSPDAMQAAGVSTPQPAPEVAAPAQQPAQPTTNKPKFNVIGAKK